ncbi:hypothetical protein LTR97_003423 [Elasticomyces elasticus]|uniref:DNA replication regulator SLD2 n=1 Tax=Elasticomyces elasticus TaxID=574655 RepID=A0AAN7WAW0_9PEZI|nr:hypothetical protein LTR97_003423 [Elasticomyces elasticus]
MATNSQILHRQVASLRVELKAWEHAFKSTHNRKASREDISNDASVREKYREYNRLQYAIDNPQGAKSVSPRKPKHLRQRVGKENLTPKKAWQKNAVSLEVVKEDEQLELEVELEQTPAFVKCGLGPTPQKDGLVLGIFDFASSATPSKTDGAAAVPLISCTPSKPAPAGPDPASSSKRGLSATPQSSSKRRMLDAFIGTPLSKRRKLDNEVSETPSTSKGRYGTPQFLRRSFPLAPVDEEGDEVPAAAVVPKKRGLVRSLSQIIQNLRKTEEKRMDDEWDILDEIENPSPAKPKATLSNALPAKVLVEDSQLPEDEGVEMPLGPDQGEAGSSDEEDGKGEVVLGRDGKPRKAWKKKGLKRQTKRTNMRPVLHKAKKASDLEIAEQEAEVVQETQLVYGDAEFVDGGEGDGDGDGDILTKAKAKKAKPGATEEKEVELDGKGKPKAKKKVAATANANFRALKIKNKNSKASGTGSGRKFGRR